jgi:GNAT superfamily N-acetyltransferase
MNDLSNPESVPVHSLLWHSDSLLEILLPHGFLTASFHPAIGPLLITNYQVDANFRKAGIGKNLLRAAHHQAVALGATAVWAHMTSRESVDAITSVFGEAAVSVGALGYYDQDRLPPHRRTETRAELQYRLAEPDQPIVRTAIRIVTS